MRLFECRSELVEKQILCTCGEYLDEVYGTRTKPFRDAVLHVFDAIVTGSSTLVSDLSRTLRRDASLAEAKRTQELVSEWLEHYDFTSPANPHLLGGAKGATDATTFAVDFSDVSKEFGGAGMEGMAMGWDGSRGVAAMGHDFVCVSLVGAAHPEAQPVYARIAQGRKSKRELIRDALDAVSAATGGLGWFAEDRGMDAAEHLRDLKALGRKAVVRVKDMKRDVFGNGRAVDETLADEAVHSVLLHVHNGDRRAELRLCPGVVRFCAEPNRRDAPVEDVRVLVVESRFGGKSIYLYAVCPDETLATPEGRLAVAARAAQAYCDRECAAESRSDSEGRSRSDGERSETPARARADRDVVPRGQAGVRAREGSGAHVQAARERLHAVRPRLQVRDGQAQEVEGLQEGAQAAFGQHRARLVADARAPRGDPRARERAPDPLHQRASEEAAGGEPAADDVQDIGVLRAGSPGAATDPGACRRFSQGKRPAERRPGPPRRAGRRRRRPGNGRRRLERGGGGSAGGAATAPKKKSRAIFESPENFFRPVFTGVP